MDISTWIRTQAPNGRLKNLLSPWLPVPRFMEPDISLRCSQQSATFPVLSHLNSVHAIQFTFKSILILFSHLRLVLPTRLYPSEFSSRSVYSCLSCPARTTCPASLRLSDLVTPTHVHTQTLKGTVCLPPRTAAVNNVKRLAWLNAAIRCSCHSVHFRFTNNMEPRWFSRCWPNDEHRLMRIRGKVFLVWLQASAAVLVNSALCWVSTLLKNRERREMNEWWMIYLTAIGCKPGGSVTRSQTEITYNNSNQHQQYIQQTIYPTLGGSQDADRVPSLRGIS